MHRVIPIESPFFISGPLLEDMPDWSAIFGNRQPILFEIGCGTGDFVTTMSARHPELNFIALDYYNKGCLKSCKRIERAGVTNVRVVRDEARSFLRRCIPKGSLAGLFINCPDPWPKRYQRRRRLVNREFVNFIASYLAPGAEFYFSTDFDDYGIDVARLMSQIDLFENMLAPDLWHHDLEQYPRTKYMLKFMAEGKQIYFVKHRRTDVAVTAGGEADV